MLRGERRIELRRDPAAKRKSKSVKKKAPLILEDAADETLFQALRERRLALATEQNVPSYVIFGDRTLVEMAHAKPRNREEFAALYGVGAAKLDRYGEDFLLLIATYLAD